MKKLLPAILFIFLSGITGTTFAQQRPQYSQYSLNNFLVNPAISGIENYTDVKMGFRKQWAGLEGAPSTFYTSFHTAIGKQDRNRINKTSMMRGAVRRPRYKVNKNNRFKKANPHHGFGGLVQVDKTGIIQNTTFNLTYAFHLPVTNSVRVAMGVATGMNQFSLNRAMATTVTANDPALYSDRLNDVKMDLGFGTWVYSDQFFVGLSAMQLLANTETASQQTGFQRPGFAQPHFYLTGGYRFDINRDLTVVPSFMVKSAPTALAADLNVKAIIAERVWGGVSYRHKDAVSVLAGINISPLLDVAYSYDAVTSELRHASSGSHEVVLGLKLQNRGKAICPQWMW
ncbi:type IX secretion system membrane protein PorP/SprF [Adhaeribacter terreus]|uniref:Type IX secretion system membrane protein PorP/SprF n=1 Tax=Adhaeribacter terreus TaxID=529703 RepID=A0ABW0EB04_9BACT